MCIENVMGRDVKAKKSVIIPTLETAKSLKDYQIVCHFHDKPIFIQKYSGRIKLPEIHKAYRQWILYSEGYSNLRPDVKDRLNSFSAFVLVRICDWVLADFTASKITVYAESHRL